MGSSGPWATRCDKTDESFAAAGPPRRRRDCSMMIVNEPGLVKAAAAEREAFLNSLGRLASLGSESSNLAANPERETK